MGYWSGVWTSLKFSSLEAGEDMMNSIGYRYLRKKDGNLRYVNNRGYKNVFIHVAKQTAMQLVEQQVNSLFPRYQRYLEGRLRETVLKQQKDSYVQVIKDREKQSEDWGKIVTPEGNLIVAKNKYGDFVKEALMIYFESDKTIEVKDFAVSDGKTEPVAYKTKTVCFIDLTASVSVQSCKNLILTVVQGRNFTRKELVCGGDLSFSVSGKIVENAPGVYPENDVKKFIQIMQYGGVVKVKHFLFSQFNVQQILVKDFSLQPSDCKNVQPYCFTCVAVEPDEDVSIVADTIGVLNAEIATSPMDRWYRFILTNQLGSVIDGAVTGNVTSGVSTSLDALIPNI